ncbi:hypothetical protein Val02_67450 [Virgisporangium aliadipatigenens]|uniref:Transcriptional regulator n=1 Tax=Virgisporangium aliadipatigenens TaxID=741659 RepID=A0A8J3YQK0_9ACTN|nr:hypothetical protein Val02_67450 [Virgisporangium aliadipatigenens]
MSGGGGAESLGALLARTRLSQGRSQLRMAELLCAASGTATVTRHEISRWERDLRVPGGHWLRWLAAVLELPLSALETAAATSRELRTRTPPRSAVPPAPPGRDVFGAPARSTLLAEARDLPRLRALDDQVGGGDLAVIVDAVLRREVAALRRTRSARRSRVRRLAGLAQLAGWVDADAGDDAGARAAHRLGLRAARIAGDRPLAAHLLGAAAHLADDPRRALALATAGAAEAARGAPGAVRALLQQRVALAAARAGERADAERALGAAESAFDGRSPGSDPEWLYWLTEPEFTAMTGRCFAVLGRPRLAVPLLEHALRGIGQPRPAALYRSYLAEAHLDAGAFDRARVLAGEVRLDAMRSGSVRASMRAQALAERISTITVRGGRGPSGRADPQAIAPGRGTLPDAG